MENIGKNTISVENLISRLSNFNYAYSFCERLFSKELEQISVLSGKFKNPNHIDFDKVLYSPLKKCGVPYSLGYFDKRVYFSSNSYRPSKPTASRNSKDDIEYYFKNDKLLYVNSGNFYQIEGNVAFSFNEKDKFICGSKFIEASQMNISVFVESGGTDLFVFYTDINEKIGALISIHSYCFLVLEYRKKFGVWREKQIIQKGLFPLENALVILKRFYPYWSHGLKKTIEQGYQRFCLNGWKQQHKETF